MRKDSYWGNDFWIYSLLFFAISFLSIIFHESMHLIFGLLNGIPAQFLSMSAVGVPKNYDLSVHEEWQLFLMNVPAAWISVLMGIILLLVILKNKKIIKTKLGFFLSWLTIINLPYLTLQMILVTSKSLANGEGADFAYMAYFWGFSEPIKFIFLILSVILPPVSYYLLSLIFEKRATQSKKDFSIVKRVVFLILFLVLVVCFLFYKYLFKGIINSNIEAYMYYLYALSLLMIVLINWKNDESKVLIKKYFLPCVFVSLIYYLPEILGEIFFLEFLMSRIYGVMSDFVIIHILVVPQVIGMILFHQARKPTYSDGILDHSI